MARFPRVLERLEFRVCARNHMKIVLVDNRSLYLGSANLTGAGLGRKSDDRRNFEFGICTTDGRIIDSVRRLSQEIWQQRPCGSCEAKRLCAFEHQRTAAALQAGGGLQRWVWPEPLKNMPLEDLAKKPR